MKLSLHSSRSKLVVPVLLGALAAGGGLAVAHAEAPAIQPAPVVASNDVSALVASVQPAVVNITVEHVVKPSEMQTPDLPEPFRDFFGNGKGFHSPGGKQVGAGSGFIIDDKGHVVTNAHVVDGADTVKVKLSDERELRAKVLGKDERLDVAVLEIQGAKSLPHVNLGSSSSLKVGEPVVAIGNPFGLGGTVTSGIVSAKSRTIGAGPYDDFIQTDASINPGNSGGPLFDQRGQVVGMNTAINPSGQGIGFAIPSDAIKEVLPQLIANGHVRRGKLGAHIQGVDDSLAKALGLSATRGALVADEEKGSPAEKAGLKDGDVVTAVDGQPVAHAHDLPRMIASHAPGSRVTLEVRRASQTLNVPVTLGELEDEKPAKDAQAEAPAAQGSIGIGVVDAQGGGALVQRVNPSGPAAGELRPGDVILEIDRQHVANAADAAAKLKAAPKGKPVLLRVKRDDATIYVAIDR